MNGSDKFEKTVKRLLGTPPKPQGANETAVKKTLTKGGAKESGGQIAPDPRPLPKKPT